MTELLTERWTSETMLAGTPNEVHEVVAEAEPHHNVAFARTAAIAAHIAELHNRTMGDGQEPARLRVPPFGSLARVGVRDIEPEPSETITPNPSDVLNDSTDAAVWAHEFMKRFQGTQADEGTMLSWFANAIENGKREAQRQRNARLARLEEVLHEVGPPGVDHSYDKAKPLMGHGHHGPSYGEGYRIGMSDASVAHVEPIGERDQALYAAHLLLLKARAGDPKLRTQWEYAVARWQAEYAARFGDGDELEPAIEMTEHDLPFRAERS